MPYPLAAQGALLNQLILICVLSHKPPKGAGKRREEAPLVGRTILSPRISQTLSRLARDVGHDDERTSGNSPGGLVKADPVVIGNVSG